jgi:hypothetical protein
MLTLSEMDAIDIAKGRNAGGKGLHALAKEIAGICDMGCSLEGEVSIYLTGARDPFA